MTAISRGAIRKILLLSLFLFWRESPVAAQVMMNQSKEKTKEVSVVKKRKHDLSRPSGTGVTLFGGFDAGTTFLQPLAGEVEGVKLGYHLGFKALGQIRTEGAGLELGGGYFRDELHGSGDLDQTQPSNVKKTAKTKIVTKAGYAEVSPNLHFGEYWQVGLVAQVLFGEDVTFAPTEETRKTPTEFVGFQFFYQGGSISYPQRVGFQYLWDVNISERDVRFIVISAQMGIGIVKRKTEVLGIRRTETQKTSEEETFEVD